MDSQHNLAQHIGQEALFELLKGDSYLVAIGDFYGKYPRPESTHISPSQLVQALRAAAAGQDLELDMQALRRAGAPEGADRPSTLLENQAVSHARQSALELANILSNFFGV